MEKKNREFGFRRGKNPQISPSSSSNSRFARENLHSKSSKTLEIPDSTYLSNKQKPENDEEDSHTFDLFILGTCPDMCPARERVQRERLRDLAVFERLNGNPQKTSPTLAVKKFCRTLSSMHVQPSDVRPLPVLQDSLVYLFKLLDSSGHPFEVVHDFISDRTRSIRQDLSMQNLINDQVIYIYEQMVKFHIVSHRKLLRCGSNPNISSLHYLNLEQLMKCLKSLYDLYDINRSSNSISKNEAEFYSFYVLLHLGSSTQSMGESLSVWFRQLAIPLLKSKEMLFARSILRCFRIGNYKRFFCTVAAGASFLQFCLIEPFFNEIRAQAVSCINYGGYKLHPYPLANLAELLMMKESDMESFCNLCGLVTSTDEAGTKYLPVKQTGFCLPKGGFQQHFSSSERLQCYLESCGKPLLNFEIQTSPA